MSSPRLRGVLFDLDDTLISWANFKGDWRAIELPRLTRVHAYCAERGMRPSTTPEGFARHYGEQLFSQWTEARTSLRPPHNMHILLDTLAHFGVPVVRPGEDAPTTGEAITLDDCLRVYGEDYGSVDGVTVFGDTLTFLPRLRERGIKIGIVTNASQPFALREKELVVHGIDDLFSDSLCKIAACDVGYLKPHPRIFEHALELMGTSADETIYIGDNPIADVAGAQSAHMRAILRVNEATPPLISGLIMPDSAVNSFEELPFIFDDWYGENW